MGTQENNSLFMTGIAAAFLKMLNLKLCDFIRVIISLSKFLARCIAFDVNFFLWY